MLSALSEHLKATVVKHVRLDKLTGRACSCLREAYSVVDASNPQNDPDFHYSLEAIDMISVMMPLKHRGVEQLFSHANRSWGVRMRHVLYFELCHLLMAALLRLQIPM